MPVKSTSFAAPLLLAFLLASPISIHAEILNVPNDYETIQSAIDAAEDGDTVLVFPGVYQENINYSGKNITVTSLFSITENGDYIDSTIIDGDANGTVVTFENGENETAMLIGLTIRDGHSEGNGGGISCIDTNPGILNCCIIENQADSIGGGIYINADWLETNITGCKIVANSADGGGGIGVFTGTVLLNDVLLAHNVAGDSLGGAIYASWFTKLTANRVTIVNNVAEDAGSIYCWAHTVQLINSILWNDTPHEVVGYTHGDGDHIIFSHCDVKGDSNGVYLINIQPLYWLDGNINADPLFVDPDSRDFSLTENSPCVDAGTAFFVWQGDTLVNIPEGQYHGLAPDMGAFESEFINDAPNQFILHPSSFILYPAYPNPFNSETMISYSLPCPSNVNVVIYNPLGQRVRTLVESYQHPGVHATTLSTADLPSGLYLVRLNAGRESFTRKIILEK
jgi:hypothetical protein